MATKKVPAKKTTPKKGVVKKPVQKESAPKPKKQEKPKMHAKNVNLNVSIGTDDRNRTIEQMVDALRKAIEKAGFKNVSLMSSYYILDGKVCNPGDYDEKTQNFKEGAVPPPWAGGPSINTLLEKVGQDEFKVERPAYSPKENMDAIRPILEANAAKKRKGKAVDDDEDLEEFDWDVDDASDEDKMEKVAKKSRDKAVAKLSKTKKKVVIKKPAAKPVKKVVKKVVTKPAKKTVVRRKK